MRGKEKLGEETHIKIKVNYLDTPNIHIYPQMQIPCTLAEADDFQSFMDVVNLQSLEFLMICLRKFLRSLEKL